MMSEYERFLVKLTDEVFNDAFKQGMTWHELAEEAGVSTTTVYNLGNRITRFPQLRTFFFLAKAVGMNVALLKKEVAHYAKAS
jgi:hypothetical protein